MNCVGGEYILSSVQIGYALAKEKNYPLLKNAELLEIFSSPIRTASLLREGIFTR